jgi:WD40 repeat protein
LYSGSNDCTVRVWSLASNSLSRILNVGSKVFSLQLHHDLLFAAGASDILHVSHTSPQIWDTRQDFRHTELSMATPGRNGHGLVGSLPLTAAQTAMCQSADSSSLLVASGEKAARIDLATMQRLSDLGPAPDTSPSQQFYSLANWGVLLLIFRKSSILWWL